MEILINVSSKMGSINGGDGGPGTGDSIGQGNNYKWELKIGEIETDSSKQKLVMNTLGSVMGTIGAVAQTTCQSVSLSGSGDYDGVHFSIGGSSELTVGRGQLQCFGSEIDLSGVDNSGFAELNALPLGTYSASPVSGVTKWPLTVIIE